MPNHKKIKLILCITRNKAPIRALSRSTSLQYDEL